MIEQFIAIHLIMEMCLDMENIPGAKVSKWWRQQGCLYLVVARAERARAEKAEDGLETGIGTGH